MIAAYKSAAEETGRNESATKLGVTRHIHVAESDDAAIGVATQAYRVWYDSNAELWRRYQTESLIFPRTLEEALASGVALVGSPETVRSKLAETIETSGINYLLGRFAFGDLSTERVLGQRCAVHERNHAGVSLEHDPEKWNPVFGKDHAPPRT